MAKLFRRCFESYLLPLGDVSYVNCKGEVYVFSTISTVSPGKYTNFTSIKFGPTALTLVVKAVITQR